MKLSNKGRYALQAVFDLAFHGEGRAVQVKDIGEREMIPARFLEQVFQDLKRAGLVRSKRGPNGGYELAMSADVIRIGDVLRAIEGPLSLAQPEPDASTEESPGQQVSRDVLSRITSDIDRCLDASTLADMCRRAEAMGLRKTKTSSYVYAI